MIKDLCPGCGKHCYLNEARCERGIEYANTGILPPRRPRPEGVPARKHSEQKMKYLAMSRDEKLAWNLQEMGAAAAQQDDAEGLFACLREEDCTALLMLLEKVKHDWSRRAREKTER